MKSSTSASDTYGQPSAAEPVSAKELLFELHSLPENSERRRALRDQVAESQLTFVAYLARRFAGKGEPLSDLIQAGSIGLLKAIDRFEPQRGLEFSTYATPTILGEIKRHFRDTTWLVHVPRRAQEIQTGMSAARGELTQALGRAPTITELAARLDVGEDVVVEALDVARAHSGVALDALAPPGESVPEHPALAYVDTGFEVAEHRLHLRAAMAGLPETEREIVALRFFEGKTQTEIARIVGVSQMQVSRLLSRGLGRLRASLGDETPPGS